MRKENSDFSTKFISEAGSYLINADYFAFVELKDYACYVIADGIDPDEKKESAKLAVTTVITEFSEAPGMSAGKLNHFLKAAHEALLRESEEIRLEASIVILLTDYKKAIWGHAGNSRLCWIRNGEIRTTTKDTSLTQRMADEEEIPIDQIAAHEERNNLYSYLGQPGRFTPVISGKKKLEDGDIFVMMTRGVWENVGNAELIDAVDGVSKAEDVCTGLEDVILSQRLEIIENYTIASVFINKIYKNPKAGRYKMFLRIGVTILIALLGIILSLTIMTISKNKSTVKKLDKYKEKGIEYLQEINYSSADKQFADAYEVTDNVKASKNSKTGKKIQIIEKYYKLAENMDLALASMKDGEYKKAAALVNHAYDVMNNLKDDFGEDVSAYEEGIKAYKTFSENMYDGTEKLKQANYAEANDCFSVASQKMNEINDTVMRDVAEFQLKYSYAMQQMKYADEEFAKGVQCYEQENYLAAATHYENAQEAYKPAALLGDATADQQMKTAETRASDARKMNSTKSDDEKISDARMLFEDGKRFAQTGKNDEAAEKFTQAIDALLGVTGSEADDLRKSINEQRDYVLEDPEQDLLNAIDCLSKQDYASAEESLKKAMESYKRLGDNTKAQQIQSYINQIKAMH